jgi:hypothetical protein
MELKKGMGCGGIMIQFGSLEMHIFFMHKLIY